MLPFFVLLLVLSLVSGQALNTASPRIVLDGATLYNEILRAAAAANNRAYPHTTPLNATSPTVPTTNTEYFATVLRHFEHLYNASQFIKKMNQLTDLEDQYLRTRLTTQIDTQLLNRTMFTTNHYPECVSQLKNRTRGIVDKANAAMKQCQSLFNEDDEVVSGVKFQLMSKGEYEKFRECAMNRSTPTTGQMAFVVDCVNVTMQNHDVSLMPLMRFSRCWRDILDGAGEIERLLRRVFAQTDNCIAQVRLRQGLSGPAHNRGSPEGITDEEAQTRVHSRVRRWRTVT